MDKMKILVTCPPMLGMIDEFRPIFNDKNIELLTPNVVQTLSEDKLMEILPTVDGWIIGDDPATRKVFEAGKKGKLKAAVKWGVGVDNVDFEACKDIGIPISNTPNMFGAEVATVAVGYLIGLARQTFFIDREVRNKQWPKPPGMSLAGKRVALLGFGDIGRATASRLKAFGLHINIYDPYAKLNDQDQLDYNFETWPNKLSESDFVVITCALNKDTLRIINKESIGQMKKGVRIVNVSRGPIIDEEELINGLKKGHIHSVALDVFENEPLSGTSVLRDFDKCILGTHNGSNTIEGVRRASYEATSILFNYLNLEIND